MLDTRRNRETQAHLLAGRQGTKAMAGFFLKPREFQDRLDLVPHVDRFQPHRRPAKKDVLAYGCLAVEAQRHVQQRLAAAVHAHPAGGWRIDAVEYSKQCRLPGAVTTKNRDTIDRKRTRLNSSH